MKVARGRVVKGAIVTRAKFPEGARLTLVQHDERAPIELDPDEEAGVLEGIRQIEAGKGIPVSKVLSKLRQVATARHEIRVVYFRHARRRPVRER